MGAGNIVRIVKRTKNRRPRRDEETRRTAFCKCGLYTVDKLRIIRTRVYVTRAHVLVYTAVVVYVEWAARSFVGWRRRPAVAGKRSIIFPFILGRFVYENIRGR